MIAVITGDIINSRKVSTHLWMSKLKDELNKNGVSPMDWEIYRGDSFQLKTTPKNALTIAIKLKTAIKQFKTLDVRMAIGIGRVSYQANKITESNGEAYIYSGECFEQLKKKTIAIKSPWNEFDNALNTMLEIMGLIMNNWSPNSSLLIKASLENPDITQKKLTVIVNKNQSNISSGLKRGGYDELNKLLSYYNQQIDMLC